MTSKAIARTLLLLSLALTAGTLFAQNLKQVSANTSSKPYKILTSGKQITIKSTKDIKTIMVWTASGHRIVEQKEINNSSFSFQINVTERYFFVMIHLEGEKPFTEKIGIQ